MIDDVTTTGTSKFEGTDKLPATGLIVRDVVVLVDRESGALEALLQAGYRLHAVLKFTEMLDYWSKHAIDPEQIAAARKFIAES